MELTTFDFQFLIYYLIKGKFQIESWTKLGREPMRIGFLFLKIDFFSKEILFNELTSNEV